MVRFKNRYLTVLVKQLSDNNKSLCDIGITEKQFFEALVVSLQINFGDYGLAMNMTSLHCHKEALSETIKGFNGIVNGDYDDLPEQAFYMVGSIEEAVEKAKTT